MDRIPHNEAAGKRAARRECAWCEASGANAGLQEIAPGSPVFLKDPKLDGTVLCREDRYRVLMGRA